MYEAQTADPLVEGNGGRDALWPVGSLGTKSLIETIERGPRALHQSPRHHCCACVKSSHKFLTREATLRERHGVRDESPSKTLRCQTHRELVGTRYATRHLLAQSRDWPLPSGFEFERTARTKQEPLQSSQRDLGDRGPDKEFESVLNARKEP